MEKGLGGVPGSRKTVVREGRVWADKHTVSDAQTVPELDPAFYGNTIADLNIAFDEDVIANVAISAYAGSRKHMGKGPYARSRADRGTLA
jgi:hypothetical protein